MSREVRALAHPDAAADPAPSAPGMAKYNFDRQYNDPAEDMTTILMIQRAHGPAGLPILFDFWTAAYQAIDD
jgi:hypothetical protein